MKKNTILAALVLAILLPAISGCEHTQSSSSTTASKPTPTPSSVAQRARQRSSVLP